jgi:Glutaminase/STAS domain
MTGPEAPYMTRSDRLPGSAERLATDRAAIDGESTRTRPGLHEIAAFPRVSSRQPPVCCEPYTPNCRQRARRDRELYSVSGGIITVLPGQLGIGVFSPRLDECGNNYRGVRVCEVLSNRLQLHLLDYRGRARPAIRRIYRGNEIRSKRVRNGVAAARLDAFGACIFIVELQGNLYFGNTDQAVRRIIGLYNVDYLVLDMARVTSIDAVGADLLREFRLGFLSRVRLPAMCCLATSISSPSSIRKSWRSWPIIWRRKLFPPAQS